MITVNADALEKWHIEEPARNDFNIVGERGQLVFCNLDEQVARLIASAPVFLKFLASVTKPHHPMSIPTTTMLANCGIELAGSMNTKGGEHDD